MPDIHDKEPFPIVDWFSYLRSLMKEDMYISVILPLLLEWEPCYSIPGHWLESDEWNRIQTGDRVKVSFANKEYIGVVSETGICPQISQERIQSVISMEKDMKRILPQEIEFWKMLSEYYMCSIGEVYKAAYPAGKLNLEEAKAISRRKERERISRSLEKKETRLARLKENLAKTQKEDKAAAVERNIIKIKLEISSLRNQIEGLQTHDPEKFLSEDNIASTSDIILTEAQKAAETDIRKAFKTGKPALLHGITGSGKTEIYIRLAEETIRNGKNVLYLVPEIALSRQLEDRLRKHFGSSLLVFHSGETASSRRNTAEKIRELSEKDTSDKRYIVLGTRSSLFLPHNHLGLIIVDEEHDSSYKQDSPAPRYNGRDAALMLHRLHGSSIILGSATPSLEEIYNCRIGKHEYVRLEERYHHSDDSDIEIIDTKAERRKNGMVGNFSRKLIARIESALERKEQIMILRSRRAWATALQCSNCGDIQKCPHCNVSLNLHKNTQDGTTLCHYCGYSAPYSGKCSKCGGDLSTLGTGTQKIEEEAARLFPQARIARLDSDSAQSKAFEIKTIKDFSKGDTDILIGTQVLTKGFDFSGLTLVAVISADTLLGIQDFRADEKAIQILEQFRGRSGRRSTKGHFVIQTSQPEHPVYQRIISGDSTFSVNELLLERKDFRFPPYTRIIEICISDKYEDRASRMSETLSEILRKAFASEPETADTITGPYSPAISKISDRHLRNIRISLPKDKLTASRKAALKKVVSRFEKTYRYTGHISIDVDPS